MQTSQKVRLPDYTADGKPHKINNHLKGEHHITVPKHKSLKIGTLNSILTDIASHLEIDKPVLIKELFGKK